ncbi:MAG TPA: translocation/assembly module TamB domain-containing protein [Bryobacteraceae bacterium]|nr:translocation/assembly module TamB domain-containing protein [Bryobacteraceae bacterium]
MSRKRIAWTLAGSLAGLLLAAAMAAIFVVQSAWFYGKVRGRILETLETATGGRVEIATFHFDWRRMRAEVTSLVLHGTEPAAKPPLFRANSVAVGLRVVSFLERDVDISYLEIVGPQVFLIVGPDGSTNVPQPKVRRKIAEPPMQTILNLAIGRFAVTNGMFEVAAGGKTPFAAHGDNLSARLLYDRDGPRYRGEIAIQPLDMECAGYHPMPAGITMAVTLERDRIDVTSARLTVGGSKVDLSGAVENLAAPRGSFRYDASVSVVEAARILRLPPLRRGTVQLQGKASLDVTSGFSAAGALNGYQLEYRDATVRLQDVRVDGAVTAGPGGIDASGLRLAGDYVTNLNRAPVGGHIEHVALRGRNLDLQGVAIAAFGGSFEGQARIRELRTFTVHGEIAGIEARPVLAMYSTEHLLWNARVSGPVEVNGDFERPAELVASATLAVAPGPESAPVHGQVTASYQARDRVLDLGHSSLSLPSSQVDFSGKLPPETGRQMRVRLETRDLDDLLPAIGERAASLPAKLTGSFAFDGTVAGNLDNPQISGRARVTGLEYSGQNFNSVETDAELSPSGVHLRNAAVARGALRAQFQLDVVLHDWKADPSSLIFGRGALRDAPLADLASLVGEKDVPLAGSLAGSAQITGTIADPQISADFELTHGSWRDEPFDRFSGNLNYTGSLIELTGGQLVAGARQAALAANFHHAPGHADTGRLRFEVSTNAMPLEQFRSVEALRPGLRGTAQVRAAGEADIAPPRSGGRAFRIASLDAEVTGHELRFASQSFGDLHLTTSSQGSVLRAHLESNAANSNIRGDGEWRLEGDYPGSATIVFPKLDLAQLRTWLEPSAAGTQAPFSGSAEGQLRIEGPAVDPQALKAELRIPQFEIGPPPETGLTASALVLHNSGPIVVRMANDVVTVDSARLVGPSTGLDFTGKVLLAQKNPLDLRVNGQVDLALLHDLNPDFDSSGTLATDATVRGSPDALQVNGRMEFKNAAFSLVGIPNGVSNANGTIVFTRERATIQSFTGETGGGKIELTGFAGYGEGPAIFRLHVRAEGVRVRYPEGVSTVANANLNLTGGLDRSMVSGTVTILRSAFNPESDFSSLLAKSAEPVQTPSARTGLVGGMNFDIQINTSPDIQFQSSLTQDIQMEANLRLRGTFSNPAVLGRINITQGRVAFFGTTYTVNQGSVAFYNPVRIDPILDIDLETKANGVDVTLNVSGPFNKPNLTPRSDPPLQFNEIVALLATGRTPTSDPTLLAQQSTSPQSWQQMGASALLGQAIASPVAGRLQRFFGVSQLRIDPTLPGVENNPQARLTLQQQVTPDITFTYITNVTTSNPEVVRVEWAFSKQWSAVALREENGLFGVDFYLKKRF